MPCSPDRYNTAMRDVLIGTAGHIDHGKTTLLKALTGIDADRLAEEKRRGITIDLGFAHLELEGVRLGFIDVPGHERFVKNMLAGIGGIRLVLLVVAADESVMPQTREHFEICRLLGIERGAIVLTKADLVDEELLELVEEEVRDMARGSFLESAPSVAVDSLSGRGMDELREVLLAQIRQLPQPDPASQARLSFRLPIDRVFSLRGFGTVVTGTATAGELAADSTVQIYPSSLIAKVRSIQVFEQSQQQARAGQRTALNLTGVDKSELARGMVVSHPGALQPTSLLDVRLHLLADAPAPLENRSPVRFHQGSSEIVGRAALLEGESLEPGQTCLVQLRLQRPTVCCAGDHFIIRRYSPMRTIGGGVILDSMPAKHTRKELKKALPALRALARRTESAGSEPPDKAFLSYFVQSSGPGGTPLPRLAARSGLTQPALQELLPELPEVESIEGEPRLAISHPALAEIQERLTAELDRYHLQNPLAPGIPQPELKSRCLPQAPDSLFEAVLLRLQQQQLAEVTAGTVRSYGRRVELSEQQTKLKDSILACFKDEQLQSPSLTELIRDLPGLEVEIRNLYYFLLQQEQLVRVSRDLVMSRRQLEWLVERVQDRFRQGQAFEVAEFKELFGITRKYAIPLLEYLDRQRITRRSGDKRILL